MPLVGAQIKQILTQKPLVKLKLNKTAPNVTVRGSIEQMRLVEAQIEQELSQIPLEKAQIEQDGTKFHW